MQEQKQIYWGKDQLYDKEIAKLKKWKTSHRNKELIMKFHNHLFAKSCGESRVSKLSCQLRKIVLQLDKDLDQVTKDDANMLIAFYNKTSEWSDATKADYRRAFKQFFLWFEDEDERLYIPDDAIKQEEILKYKKVQRETQKFYRYLKKEVNTRYKLRKPEFKEILTDKDIKVVIDKGCNNSKEKALVKVLHEGGFRVGELLNIQIGDLDFKNDRVVMQVDGKTGQRNVPIVQSMGLLSRWLEEHPFPDNPKAYLWTSHNHRNMHQPLMYAGCVKVIKRCFGKANMLHKRHNPHWFRHSRATLLGRHLTEQMMCSYFGWEQGSGQVKTYCHHHSSQVEDAVLTMHGLKKEEEKLSLNSKCSSCMMINESEARYCRRCGKALNVNILLEDDSKKSLAIDEAFELLQKIMSNPEMAKKFEKFRETPVQDNNTT